MPTSNDQYESNRLIVLEFLGKRKIDIAGGSIRQGDGRQGEPAICCILPEGEMYFEVVNASSPEFDDVITQVCESSPPRWVSDDPARLLRDVRGRAYNVRNSIELILHQYIPMRHEEAFIDLCKQYISSRSPSELGPFTKIWLLADELHLIAP